MRLLFPALALALLSITVPADATRRIKIVDIRTAAQREGNLAAVRGRAEIHEDQVVPGLDVNIVGRDGRVEFIGFIPRLNQYAFPQAASLNGKQVVMYGVIEFYQGVPATQLVFTDQLRAAPGT